MFKNCLYLFWFAIDTSFVLEAFLGTLAILHCIFIFKSRGLENIGSFQCVDRGC